MRLAFYSFSPLLIGSCLDGWTAGTRTRARTTVSVPYSSGVALTVGREPPHPRG